MTDEITFVNQHDTLAEMQRACDLVMANDLCYLYGSIQSWCGYPPGIKSIYIYYKDKPVGALLILKHHSPFDGHNCGIFVSEIHRYQGVGRSLINKALSEGEQLRPWTSCREAKAFYQKVLPHLPYEHQRNPI